MRPMTDDAVPPEEASPSADTSPAAGATWRRVALILFTLWAVVFCAGALGELLDIEWLRRATDFKRFFLR